jgi:hypothetical protein
MRDHEAPQVGASDDPVDRLLDAEGARWRAGQSEPRSVDGAWFAAIPRGRDGSPTLGGHAWSFTAGAASAIAVVIALAVAAPNLLSRFGGAAVPATVGPGTGYIATGRAHCPLTKPNGAFTPPPRPGADYDLSGDRRWYGTAKLWTWLMVDGEVWAGLPRSDAGLTQKTFWWREGYDVRREPTPAITVLGMRLDGPGRFGFGPGTNASFGQGSAMLVGIQVPEPGCWEVTARYYDESLSYVVWVGQ